MLACLRQCKESSHVVKCLQLVMMMIVMMMMINMMMMVMMMMINMMMIVIMMMILSKRVPPVCSLHNQSLFRKELQEHFDQNKLKNNYKDGGRRVMEKIQYC